MRFEIVNPGNTEAKFEFLFPADLRLELEGWADNAELSKSQYDILQVEDNKLFQVTLTRQSLCILGAVISKEKTL